MKQLLIRADLRADELAVDAATTHRVRKVLRLRAGHKLVVADGDGKRRPCVWTGRALRGDGDVESTRRVAPEIVLALGLLKGPRWTIALEKCAELGVDAVQPLLLDHCVAVPNAAKWESKIARWQATLDEAFEQCGRAHAPRILAPASLPHGLQSGENAWLTFGEEREGSWLRDVRVPAPDCEKWLVAIAPEGGWSAAERAHLAEVGATPILWSSNVLRAETAAIVAVAGMVELRRLFDS